MNNIEGITNSNESINVFRKSNGVLTLLLYILMFLNLGIGNISPGFLYFYTPTTSIVAIVSLAILILGLLIQSRGKIYFDSKLLALQALLVISSFVTLLLNEVGIPSIISSIFSVVYPLFLCIVTITFTKKNDGMKFLRKFISIYASWLSLQTIFMAVNLFFTYGTISKSLLKVSIGGSNYIATHLIVCFIFMLLNNRKDMKKIERFAILITTASIVLTISFGAWVSLLIITLLIMKKRLYRMKNIFILIIIGLVIMLITNDYILNVIDNNSLIFSVILNFNKKVQYLFEGNYTRLLAGRDLIYDLAIKAIFEKPIFGHSNFIAYFGVETRTHNWVIDSIVTKGIVGAIIFATMVFYTIKNINKNIKYDNRLFAVKYALITGLIHGLVEPNFFSRPFDFLWWVIAGIAIGEIRKKDKRTKISSTNLGG